VKEIAVIFPHQLFENHPAVAGARDIVLVENPLFFNDEQYPLSFHKMKLTFHRASMKVYESEKVTQKHRIFYLDYPYLRENTNGLFTWLRKNNYGRIHFCEVDDYLLNKRLRKGLNAFSIEFEQYDNPSFLNDQNYLREYFASKKSYLQHFFYVEQRKKHNILTRNGKPLNGKWSFDADNRKPIPKTISIPALPKSEKNQSFIAEAKQYVQKNFHDNPGSFDNFYLPVSAQDSKQWFEVFLAQKFELFGTYQDAIKEDESYLLHSIISPMMNVGLITPKYILERTLRYIHENTVPLNSSEGFIRQILGWREFIRGIYTIEGVKQRNSNFWNNHRKIPDSFYHGTTGIEPIDATIKKLLQTGYNHHIERLMILGNFMLLCEIHPTQVYQWFMEMYIDAYDWVMVPNVYGMSQFADGGLMSTKPYISSSNYIRKMSDFQKGDWTVTWDALFWNFVSKHEAYFAKNNRTVFLYRNLKKMSADKLQNHLETAQDFIDKTF